MRSVSARPLATVTAVVALSACSSSKSDDGEPRNDLSALCVNSEAVQCFRQSFVATDLPRDLRPGSGSHPGGLQEGVLEAGRTSMRAIVDHGTSTG